MKILKKQQTHVKLSEFYQRFKKRIGLKLHDIRICQCFFTSVLILSISNGIILDVTVLLTIFIFFSQKQQKKSINDIIIFLNRKKRKTRMANIDELSDELRQQLGSIENKINSLTKLKGNDRQEMANKHEKRLNGIKNLMNHYKFSIEDADDDVDRHKSQLKQFQLKISQLAKKLDYTRNESVKEEDIFKHRTIGTSNQDLNDRQMVIQKGHQVQKESKDAVDRIRRNVYNMEDQAKEINTELDRQINQLDSIYDNMKDTETTLKRAENHLKYFARQIYTDRLMICLIVVIVLAIIAIIILKAIGKDAEVEIDNLK